MSIHSPPQIVIRVFISRLFQDLLSPIQSRNHLHGRSPACKCVQRGRIPPIRGVDFRVLVGLPATQCVQSRPCILPFPPRPSLTPLLGSDLQGAAMSGMDLESTQGISGPELQQYAGPELKYAGDIRTRSKLQDVERVIRSGHAPV